MQLRLKTILNRSKTMKTCDETGARSVGSPKRYAIKNVAKCDLISCDNFDLPENFAGLIVLLARISSWARYVFFAFQYFLQSDQKSINGTIFAPNPFSWHFKSILR